MNQDFDKKRIHIVINATITTTVKLDYNEHGYNENLVITNKFCGPNGHFAA